MKDDVATARCGVTAAEAARLLGISPQSMHYYLLRDRVAGARQLGRLWDIPLPVKLIPLQRPLAPHGTLRRYYKGCRCDGCLETIREYSREVRRLRRKFNGRDAVTNGLRGARDPNKIKTA